MEINLFHLHERRGEGGSDLVITGLTSRSHTFDRGLVLSWSAASLQQGGVKQVKSSVWGCLRTKSDFSKRASEKTQGRFQFHPERLAFHLLTCSFWIIGCEKGDGKWKNLKKNHLIGLPSEVYTLNGGGFVANCEKEWMCKLGDLNAWIVTTTACAVGDFPFFPPTMPQ